MTASAGYQNYGPNLGWPLLDAAAGECLQVRRPIGRLHRGVVRPRQRLALHLPVSLRRVFLPLEEILSSLSAALAVCPGSVVRQLVARRLLHHLRFVGSWDFVELDVDGLADDQLPVSVRIEQQRATLRLDHHPSAQSRAFPSGRGQ